MLLPASGPYTRGVPADYNQWSQLGCLGWTWDEVLPYFLKAEINARGEGPYHGVGGPLNVSDERPHWDLVDRFLEASEQAGLPRNPDLNGPRQEGIGYHQYTTHKGRRWSTAKGYLRPARNRSNLTIATNALATRIEFEANRAVGVQFVQNGVRKIAKARCEVVVSGGTINSPQLLQLSGIGPAYVLKESGIDVVVESPLVGENLQDHFHIGLAYRCVGAFTLNEVAMSRWRSVLYGAQCLLFRKGRLAGNSIYAGGYLRTDPLLENSDIAINFYVWSIDPDSASGSILATHKFPGFSFSVVLQRPDARGSVHIKSANPAEPPRIRYGFPGSERDLNTLVKGVRISRRIAEQPALARHVAEEVLPGSADTDAELRDYVARQLQSAYHIVGTCQMGLPDRSVVDERLRVRGVQGLRVVDASIMPMIPAANTNAPSIMIGEKGAAMIAEDSRR